MTNQTTKQNVIDHLIQDVYYEQFILNYFKTNKKYLNEFRQEVWLILLQIPENKLISLYNEKRLKYYYAGIIKNQLLSNKSPFHKKFRQCNTIEFIDNNIDTEEDLIKIKNDNELKINYIENKLKKLEAKDPYLLRDITIFKMHYYESMTYRAIAKQLNISLTSVSTYINNIKFELKRNITKIKTQIEIIDYDNN